MSSYPTLHQHAVTAVVQAKNGGRLPPPYTSAMRIPLNLVRQPNGNIKLVHAQTGMVLGTAASQQIAEQTRDFFAR